MNPLATKLQEAAQQAAHTMRAMNHPHTSVIERMRLVQDVADESRLYVCLPVPNSQACLLFPHEEHGIPQNKLYALSVHYWSDKLIGYVNAAVTEGLLPGSQETPPSQSPPPPSPAARFADGGVAPLSAR